MSSTGESCCPKVSVSDDSLLFFRRSDRLEKIWGGSRVRRIESLAVGKDLVEQLRTELEKIFKEVVIATESGSSKFSLVITTGEGQ